MRILPIKSRYPDSVAGKYRAGISIHGQQGYVDFKGIQSNQKHTRKTIVLLLLYDLESFCQQCK